MKTFSLLSDNEFQFNESKLPSVRERTTLIADWMGRQENLDFNVVSSEFRYLTKDYSHYLVTVKTEHGAQLSGHGRSEDPHLAFIKGFNEAVERLAMSVYFNDPPPDKLFIQRNYSTDGKMVPGDFKIRFPPSRRLHNSNGWAVHSQLREAFVRALHEALERHSMQLHYWNEGLSFLRPVKSFNEGDYQVKLSVTPAGFGSLQTVSATLTSLDAPGALFGHTTVDKINQDSWVHPQIEAYQIAESIRLSGREDRLDNVFDRIQRSFWFEDRFVAGGLVAASIPQLENLDLNIVAVDLKKWLDLPFELFACWTFSDEIMPLYLESTVSDMDQKVFAEQFRHITGRDAVLFQTPFI